MAGGLGLAGLAPSLPVLIAALAALGAGSGMQDVSMNAHGVEVERRYGRPILAGFHAVFSVGGMLGAAVGGVAAGANVDVSLHLVLTAGIVALLGVVAWSRMLQGHVDRVAEAPLFQRPSAAVVGLGLLAFGSMIAEGSVADWSAVLMSGPLGADAATAAFAFAAFSLTMTAGRYAVGDNVVHRFGPVAVTRWVAVIALGGFIIALAVGTPAGGILGFALAGIGLACMVPVIYRAAGRIPGVPRERASPPPPRSATWGSWLDPRYRVRGRPGRAAPVHRFDGIGPCPCGNVRQSNQPAAMESATAG